jgi:hypothetical protein
VEPLVTTLGWPYPRTSRSTGASYWGGTPYTYVPGVESRVCQEQRFGGGGGVLHGFPVVWDLRFRCPGEAFDKFDHLSGVIRDPITLILGKGHGIR